MPRRSPPPPDPDRLRALLAPSQPLRRPAVPPAPEPADPVAEPAEPGSAGWVPEEPPHTDAWVGRLEQVGDLPPVGPGKTHTGEARTGPGDVGRHRPAPRVLTVPVAVRGARITVSWRTLVAAAILVVVAGGAFAVRLATAQVVTTAQPPGPGAGARAEPTVQTSVTDGMASSATPAVRASPSASTTPRSSLLVDVVGHVARPGVVSVPDGARVQDVLAAAGGPLPGADVPRLNLARPVSDGEQVFVPRPGETPPLPIGPVGPVGPVPSGAAGALAGSGASRAAQLNLNTATQVELDELPGVGPVLAQRILEWRAAHGRFSSVDELGEVSGIGDKLMAELRPRVRVS